MFQLPGRIVHDSVKLPLSLDIFLRNYIVSLETMLDTPLLLAHQAIRRLTAKALSTLDISADEARVLEVLGKQERPTMGLVAAKAGLLLPALSKLADRLETRGLAWSQPVGGSKGVDHLREAAPHVAPWITKT